MAPWLLMHNREYEYNHSFHHSSLHSPQDSQLLIHIIVLSPFYHHNNHHNHHHNTSSPKITLRSEIAKSLLLLQLLESPGKKRSVPAPGASTLPLPLPPPPPGPVPWLPWWHAAPAPLAPPLAPPRAPGAPPRSWRGMVIYGGFWRFGTHF